MHQPKNASLFIGISLPIVMILFVAASIYLPGIFVKPKYSFLYTTQEVYSRPSYEVTGAKINLNCEPDTYSYTPNPVNCTPEAGGKLFVHDLSSNTSREISYTEAQQLTLNSVSKSDDGYEIIDGNTNSNFLSYMFGGGRDYQSKYLKGHGISKKLNLQSTSSNSYSYYNFHFLGWINK